MSRDSEPEHPQSALRAYDDMDLTLLDEMALLNAMPLGVDDVDVPVGAEGLRQDWNRVGQFLRNAMGPVDHEESEVLGADERKGIGIGASSMGPEGSDGSQVPSSHVTASASKPNRDSLSDWLAPDDPVHVKEEVQALEVLGSNAPRAIQQASLRSASQFAQYEVAVPGAGERILQMAEKEQDLRDLALRMQFRSGSLRILTATSISAFALAVAALGHYFGSPWPAVPIGLAGSLGLICSAFKASTGDRD